MLEEIKKIKEKREFVGLPDSLIEKAFLLNKRDIKLTRAFLRKYFGVFLTNKVVKSKFISEDILKDHISSKKRDYAALYSKILEDEKTIIDLGCGVNGFSYSYMQEFLPDINYVGIEAADQLVEKMNLFFSKHNFNASARNLDLFNLDDLLPILSSVEKPRIVFLFQVIDALESFEKNYSKKLLLAISPFCEKIVLSYSLKSISGKSMFQTNRNWIKYFIHENFLVLDEFDLFDEHYVIFKKKS